MKKLTKLWTGTIAFVAIFYQQGIGLNVSLLALIVWLLLFLTPMSAKQKDAFRILSAWTFFAALSFAWYGDAFSFLALIMSLLVLALKSQYPSINIALYPFIWLINYAGFIFKFFSFRFWLPEKIAGKDSFKKVLAMVLIPVFFVTVFLVVYAAASDTIYNFLSQVPFDFNFVQFFFLTALGFFLFFNLWFVFIPRYVVRINGQLDANFSIADRSECKRTLSFLEIDFERKSGEISLGLLNILLVIFIIVYNYEQFFSVASHTTLSDEIHQRVATIILSIVLAIGIIMFYFKSTFNFDPNALLLKRLAYLWIFLNGLLIISAFVKNAEYVSHFGLTYKRIGVYVFLSLSMIGLVMTFVKIYLKKTNTFLVTRMMKIFFVTLVIAASTDFSWIVTKYNLVMNKATDIEYLQGMQYNKQILFDNFKNDASWENYFAAQQKMVEKETSKSLLSSSVYYRWLHLNE